MPELHMQSSQEPPAEDRLGSWKAIAAYLKRDVTTVQRWERREGMPIHRHVHDKRGSVYAFRSELDEWLKNRRGKLEAEPLPKRKRVWVVPLVIVLLAIAIPAAWQLTRPSSGTRNPLADARISPLTDFEGLEQAAAISRDGKFVAFISDRGGAMDAWVTQIGTGEFHNLTQGRAPELLNSEVRSVAFTPDGSFVTLWTRSATRNEDVNIWAAPTMGGALREYRPGAVELDSTSDGRRVVFHTAAEGDPIFVVDSSESTPRQIYVAPRGVHNHFPTWAPDDKHIYFVRGSPPGEMDIWRMTEDGAEPQRITHHNTRVLYPTFVDRRTLLYLATEDDGSGPWLYTMDVERGTSRRISFGVEQYTSLAASADGRRLVATVEHGKTSLWRVPITDNIAEESDASRIAGTTVGALSPRVGPSFLVYVAAKPNGHSIWKLANGTATELWSASGMRVIGGPSIAPDGASIAFCAEGEGGAHLYVADVDRSATRLLSGELNMRGSPAWSADGKVVTVAVDQGGEPHLFNVSVDTQEAKLIKSGYAINPQWSPDGAFLVYADADAGPSFALKGVDATGADYPLPEIKLPRGARRAAFVPGQRALVVLQGEMRHNNFWYIDLETGSRRQLTNFGRDFTIRDFDITTDGREIIFDRRSDNSDLALIELNGN
jgi:Tol biopolymer transport system component